MLHTIESQRGGVNATPEEANEETRAGGLSVFQRFNGKELRLRHAEQ